MSGTCLIANSLPHVNSTASRPPPHTFTMPIPHRRLKAKPHRPKLVDLGNVPLASLNYITPSDADVSRIKDSLINASLQLEQLESNISRTQRRLDSLRARRDELLTQTDRYRIAIAPYKRLPTEIMREIFVACLPQTVQLPPRSDEAPLLLTRVCSSWRTLALETQELWSTFEVLLSTRPFKNNNALNASRTWLSRCPDRPLSFKVTTAPRAPFPLPGVRHPILPVDLIIPHARRIRRLDLHNISGEQMNVLIALPQGSFPLLEELEIFLRDSWMFRMEEPQETAAAFRDSTRLRSVAIRGFDGTFNPVALNLPWDKLLSLHLDTLLSSPLGCHVMLRLCRSLREASVRVMRIEDSTSRLLACVSPTHLPHLRSFTIRFESTAYHGKFMEPFILPSLRTLETRFDWRNDTTTTTTLGTEGAATTPDCYTQLISRSACPVETLHIGQNSLELDLGRLFAVAKELRELTLADHIRVPAEVWERIGKGEIGVKLRKLGVSVTVVDPLLDMLEARLGISAASVDRESKTRMNIDCIDVEGEISSTTFEEILLVCPKPTFLQKRRMEALEKCGLRIILGHYRFFEH